MPKEFDTKKPAIVTTSWDDGDPLDLVLAQKLASYNLRGTFYVPLERLTMGTGKRDKLPVMDTSMIRSISRMGMEIGSHTSTHAILTKQSVDVVLSELTKSKKILEGIIEEPIVSFCYPNGKFNRVVKAQVIKAGYKLARTTISFSLESNFDLFCMPVSFQLFPHTHACHIRHALRYANLKGLVHWYRFLGMENDLVRLSELMSDYILEYGGILHIWGHSWEIEQFGLWGVLEEVFRRIANRQEVLYLTNAQILKVIGK